MQIILFFFVFNLWPESVRQYYTVCPADKVHALCEADNIDNICIHVLGDSVGTHAGFLINLMYHDYMYVKTSKVFSHGRKVCVYVCI